MPGTQENVGMVKKQDENYQETNREGRNSIGNGVVDEVGDTPTPYRCHGL